MARKRSTVLDLHICWAVLLAFCSLSLFPPDAGASLVASRLSDGTSFSGRAAQIESIRTALETEVVARRLTDLGLSPLQVEEKLSGLNDEQLHRLAGLSGDLAGGGILESVIAVLLIVFIVVVILKITDKEIIIR